MSETTNQPGVDAPIQRLGGPNWCSLCDNPSDSEVAYLNFAEFGGSLHVEFLCRDHLWETLEEQEEDHLDIPPAFIPFDVPEK